MQCSSGALSSGAGAEFRSPGAEGRDWAGQLWLERAEVAEAGSFRLK